jgi:hypothetical protein
MNMNTTTTPVSTSPKQKQKRLSACTLRAATVTANHKSPRHPANTPIRQSANRKIIISALYNSQELNLKTKAEILNNILSRAKKNWSSKSCSIVKRS